MQAPEDVNSDRQAKRLIGVIIALGIVLVLIAGGIGGVLMLQKGKATQSLTEFSFSSIQENSGSAPNLPTIDWDYWAHENPDIVAWIVIPGTSISQPVAYAPCREEGYYLTHDSSGMPNIYGCPYITNRCEKGIASQNALILGHNMSDGTMFAELLSYQDASFLAEHRSVFLLTPNETQEYTVSKVYHANSPLTVEQTECKTITLVTCAHLEDSPERLLVAAQLAGAN